MRAVAVGTGDPWQVVSFVIFGSTVVVLYTSSALYHALVPPRMPKKLLVIGSGAIGIEFASFYNTLGAETTVVPVADLSMAKSDSDDPVPGVQQAAQFCRSADHGLLHYGIVVFAAQHRAYAFQGEAHADVKVLRGAR